MQALRARRRRTHSSPRTEKGGGEFRTVCWEWEVVSRASPPGSAPRAHSSPRIENSRGGLRCEEAEEEEEERGAAQPTRLISLRHKRTTNAADLSQTQTPNNSYRHKRFQLLEAVSFKHERPPAQQDKNHTRPTTSNVGLLHHGGTHRCCCFLSSTSRRTRRCRRWCPLWRCSRRSSRWPHSRCRRSSRAASSPRAPRPAP